MISCLKQWERRDLLKNTVKRWRVITKFIYNHNCGRALVCPGASIFETNFLVLHSLLREKDRLSRFFHSTDWFNSHYRDSIVGQRVEKNYAWYQVLGTSLTSDSINIMEPMHHILRAMDNESFQSLGSVHRSIGKMKELIQQVPLKSHALVHKIIDERWLSSMNAPFDKAGIWFSNIYIKLKKPVYCYYNLKIRTKKWKWSMLEENLK